MRKTCVVVAKTDKGSDDTIGAMMQNGSKKPISLPIIRAIDEWRRVFHHVCDCFEHDAPRVFWVALGLKGLFNLLHGYLGW